jgi:ribosomal protein S15P/S13E
MPFEDVAAEIDRMKRDLGVELDRDLAVDLGIDPTAVSAWRRRNRVPSKYQLRFSRLRDERAASHGQPLSNRPDAYTLRDAYVFSLVAMVAQKLGNQPLGAGSEYDAAWIGFRLARLHDHLKAAFRDVSAKDALRSAFETKRTEIMEADLEIWLETL